MITQEIQSIFSEHRNEHKAAQMQVYMKNRFLFYGIPSPLRKEFSKDLLKISKDLEILDARQEAIDLWNLPERELHYFAMDMLDKHKKNLSEQDLELGEFLVTHNSWWDTVDYLATHFFYPILQNLSIDKQKDFILYAAFHQDMWMNRIAIIWQLMAKSETNTELLELAILPHTNSKEFFHRKAIGWALRQYSKTNPAYVVDFLTKHELSKLSVKEASKYL